MKNARIWVGAALVVLGACSGGLTKEEYIEQADQICEEADAKTAEIQPPKTPQELEGFVDQAEEVTAQLLRDLRDLEPPEEGRETIEQMLAKIEEAMGYLPEIEEAARQRNTQELASIAQRLQSAASEANELAQEYGLEKCGQSQPAAVP